MERARRPPNRLPLAIVGRRELVFESAGTRHPSKAVPRVLHDLDRMSRAVGTHSDLHLDGRVVDTVTVGLSGKIAVPRGAPVEPSAARQIADKRFGLRDVRARAPRHASLFD